LEQAAALSLRAPGGGTGLLALNHFKLVARRSLVTSPASAFTRQKFPAQRLMPSRSKIAVHNRATALESVVFRRTNTTMADQAKPTPGQALFSPAAKCDCLPPTFPFFFSLQYLLVLRQQHGIRCQPP